MATRAHDNTLADGPTDCGNDLLRTIVQVSQPEFSRLIERVSLKQGSVLCEIGQSLTNVYFPQNCVLSIMTVLESGSSVATAVIGREGAFGIVPGPEGRPSDIRCIVTIGGTAFSLKSSHLRAEFENSKALLSVMLNYSEEILADARLTAACNALHPTGARLCRWLLVLHDRAETDTIPLTHEFMSSVLGANRTTVSIAANALQSLGLISYKHGSLSIMDRAGLERASCDCYAASRKGANPDYAESNSG